MLCFSNYGEGSCQECSDIRPVTHCRCREITMDKSKDDKRDCLELTLGAVFLPFFIILSPIVLAMKAIAETEVPKHR